MKRLSPFNTSIKQMIGMIDKGTIVFDNPYQRPSGQWKAAARSLAIHSIFTFFIPELTAIKDKREVNEKEVNVYDTVDGRQRATTIYDFRKDKLRLTNLPPFKSDIDGETYDISGMIYSEMPEVLKDEFDSYTINIRPVELDEDDDYEEVSRELVLRLNNGTQMSGAHLALVAAKPETVTFVKEQIDNHPLLNTTAHFAEGSIIKSEPQMAVFQSLALVGGYDWKTFGTGDIRNLFSKQVVEPEVFDQTKKTFDFLYEALPEYTKFFTKVFLPAAVSLVVNNDFDPKVKEFLKYYVVNNNKTDPYRRRSGGSTTKKDNVEGRIKGLQEMYESYVQANPEQMEWDV